jgi:5-methylcytosine-specific restriction endonuclease McrA
MAGNRTGALKTAAKACGVTPAEYAALQASGLRRCWKCRRWKDGADSFGQDKSRPDGLGAVCLDCRRVTAAPGRAERGWAAVMKIRWCPSCSDWRPLRDFSRYRCGPCQRVAVRRWYHDKGRAGITARVRARHARHRPPPLFWVQDQMDRFGGKCAYGCGRSATGLDHLVPIAQGGETVPWNLVPCCQRCNSSKGDRDVEAWMRSVGRPIPEEMREAILDTMVLEHESLGEGHLVSAVAGPV